MHRILKYAALGAVAANTLAAARVAGAQGTAATDARWQPWLGCWQPAGPAPLTFGNEAASVPLVCVVPAGGSSVDVATVADGKVSSRERVDAGGARVPSTQDGCDGWRSGRWSPDGARVYLQSEYSCPGSARRASTGLLAISAEGELLDVERIGVDTHRAVRTLRYRPAPVPAVLAAEIPAAAADWHNSATARRQAAGAALSIDDVKEIAKAVDASVLEALLVERHQKFDLDARTLVALADAGVPSKSIDVMVALAYPEHFAVNATPESTRGTALQPTVYGTLQPIGGYGSGYGSGYGYGNDFYGWNSYSPFGYGYGYGGSWYSPTGPIIVVRNPNGTTAPQHGRIERGRGYTRDGGSSAGTTRDAGSGGSSGTSTARTPAPPPAPAAEPSGRTAKPRP